jgi:hypothetical protein
LPWGKNQLQLEIVGDAMGVIYAQKIMGAIPSRRSKVKEKALTAWQVW